MPSLGRMIMCPKCVLKKLSREQHPAEAHTCVHCSRVFPTWRALGMHMRMQHQEASSKFGPKWFDSESAACPICGSGFSTRLRLVAHLSEKRTRHGRAPCFTQVEPHMRITPEECARLDEIDREARRAAKKKGHTQPLTAGLVTRPH